MRTMSGGRRGLVVTQLLRSDQIGPTLLLVPYNPVEDAMQAVQCIPDATMIRLAGHSGHAVAAEGSPRLADIGTAIDEFLARHTS